MLCTVVSNVCVRVYVPVQFYPLRFRSLPEVAMLLAAGATSGSDEKASLPEVAIVLIYVQKKGAGSGDMHNQGGLGS